MSTLTKLPQMPETIYPESDGKPMADNTKQYEWIVTIKENLDSLLIDAFVAADLFWYPVEGNARVVQAPDVMVVKGRPKGHRPSYKQWQEGGIAPQIAFEILSPSNTFKEMAQKLDFYDRYGVEEYYIYDPDREDLVGYQRQQGKLLLINEISTWVSPKSGIRFELGAEGLKLYLPNGQQFITFQELLIKVAAEKERADQEQQRADQERQEKEAALEKLAELNRKLRELGIDLDGAKS